MRFRLTLVLLFACACSSHSPDKQPSTPTAGQGGGGASGGGGSGGAVGTGEVGGHSGSGGSRSQVSLADASTSADDKLDAGPRRHDAALDAGDTMDRDASSLSRDGAWLIAVRGSDGKAASVSGVALAADGSVYVVGSFTSSANVGSADGNDQQVDALGDGMTDGFFARFDAQGALQWVVAIGGTDSAVGAAVAVMSGGDVVVTGTGAPMTIFGQTTGDPVTVAAAMPARGPFLARYTASGKLVWALTSGSSDGAFGNGLAVATIGDAVYMGGMVRGAAQLGSVTGPGASIAGGNNGAGFVARYKLSGELEWATQLMDGESSVSGVAATDDGVYIGGTFEYTSTFEAVVGQGKTLMSGNEYEDSFVARYGNDGSLDWVNRIGSIPLTASWTDVYALTLDPKGHVVVSGVGVGSGGTNDLTFESIGGDPVVLHTGGAFAATYSSAGKVDPILQVGESPYAISIPDQTFVAGQHLFPTTFYGLSGASKMLDMSEGYDGYVVAFDTDGELDWLQSIGPAGDQSASGVAANATAAYVVGTFNTGCELGDLKLDGVAGTTRGFIARVPR